MSSISFLNNLYSNYIQPIVSPAAQNSSSATAVTSSQTENGQLSPFAQLVSTLQQLQQSNPAEYKQLTQQISTNLKNAAQTATADGDTTQATQLNQLATDFSSASQSGQLPNLQDLAQAAGGGHHHHHANGASSDANSLLNQQLAAFQANSAQNDATNPIAIITNTLSSAGVNLAQ